MTEPLRIGIITQTDRLFLPRNVDLICGEDGLEVVELTILDSKGSLDNMRRRLIRWFGPVAVCRLALRILRAMVLDATHRMSGLPRTAVPSSLRSVARAHGVPVRVEQNANDPRYLARLRRYDLDVIVSFSAPQVFKEELLLVPRHGCLNLHCSLLPKYRGLLPSFWVLHHGETESGATVHRMGTEIDNGDLLRQTRVDITGLRRMVEVLERTKRAGAEAMLEVLRELRDGKVPAAIQQQDQPTYFSWPTEEDVRAFRSAGLTLA